LRIFWKDVGGLLFEKMWIIPTNVVIKENIVEVFRRYYSSMGLFSLETLFDYDSLGYNIYQLIYIIFSLRGRFELPT